MEMRFYAMFGIAFFYALIFFIGHWASKREKADHQQNLLQGGEGGGTEKSLDSLLLASRKMPLWVGIFTMTATWVGGGYINGTAEVVYGTGALWCQAPWGYALSLLVGGIFFAGKMRAKGYTTLLDPFAEKYGHHVAAMLFVPALIGEVFWSAAILAALGSTFSTLFQIPYAPAIIVSAIVAVCYTYMGGLWSVAYTDVAQLVLIVGGIGFALPFALSNAGGWSVVWSNYQEHFGGSSSFIPNRASFELLGDQVWTWGDQALLLIFGGIPWGVYFQRVLATPSAKIARRVSCAASLLCLLFAIPPFIIGVLAQNIDWPAITGGITPDKAMILPFVLKYLTPDFVAILGLGAVAAGVMSSVDSSILSASSMFVWNIYRPFFHRATGDESKRLRKVLKGMIVVMGFMATTLALQVKSVYALWYLCADLVYVLLFPQLVMALFGKNLSKQGAIAGLGVSLVLRLGGGEPSLNFPAMIPYPMIDAATGLSNFPFRTFAMAMGFFTMVFTNWVMELSRQNLLWKIFPKRESSIGWKTPPMR